MDEIIALENQIRDALPRADTAAAMFDDNHHVHAMIRFAHDILCNGWTEPGSRLDRLRTIAAALKNFTEEKTCEQS
jgi:hypothetical protein